MVAINQRPKSSVALLNAEKLSVHVAAAAAVVVCSTNVRSVKQAMHTKTAAARAAASSERMLPSYDSIYK